MTSSYSVRNLVEFLVEHLSKETSLTGNWDKTLPQFVSIQLSSPNSVLIVSQAQFQYVVNWVRNGKVHSCLVKELSHASAVQALNELTNSASSQNLESLTSGSTHPKAVTSIPSSSSMPQGGESFGRINPYGTRDPNAPPGFENEPTISSTGPKLHFDPDQDLHPPGGKYPLLSPMGPASIGPRGGGMHPYPLDPDRPSGIRYDPTSPFDRKPTSNFSGYNSGLGGSGFGNPSGPNLPF